jgi:hypothetical protein
MRPSQTFFHGLSQFLVKIESCVNNFTDIEFFLEIFLFFNYLREKKGKFFHIARHIASRQISLARGPTSAKACYIFFKNAK